MAADASGSGLTYPYGVGMLVRERDVTAGQNAPSPDQPAVEHVPVLLDEVLAALAPGPDGRYVDGTVGAGGHAASLLARSVPGGMLLGLDRDPTMLAIAARRLAPFGGRVILEHASFDALDAALHRHGWEAIDGILLDLGWSSIQLATPGRGLSFQRDEPLDMRLDPTSPGATAEQLVNELPEAKLADLIYRYGEEPAARRIAREVVRRRERGAMRTTGDLHDAVWRAVGGRRPAGIDPATRTFQALRIAVNDELGRLERALPLAIAALRPGGRLAIISFHSLEDRIVKEQLARAAAVCICPPGLPECRCGHRPEVRLLTRKPITPGTDEVKTNPRSRSAKLRVAEKLIQGEQGT